METTEKAKTEINRRINFVLFVALFFTMLASIIGCKKEPEQKCYECTTYLSYQFDDGSSRSEGSIKVEKLCEENPNKAYQKKGEYFGKQGVKTTVRRCKTIR